MMPVYSKYIIIRCVFVFSLQYSAHGVFICYMYILSFSFSACVRSQLIRQECSPQMLPYCVSITTHKFIVVDRFECYLKKSYFYDGNCAGLCMRCICFQSGSKFEWPLFNIQKIHQVNYTFEDLSESIKQESTKGHIFLVAC